MRSQVHDCCGVQYAFAACLVVAFTALGLLLIILGDVLTFSFDVLSIVLDSITLVLLVPTSL